MTQSPFEVWKTFVDFILFERAGLGIDNFEVDLESMHEDGINPQAAANSIIGSAHLFDSDCEDCES